MTRRRKISALRAARLRIGITAIELAARLGVTPGTVNANERNGIRSVATAMRYAEALHTDPDLIMEFKFPRKTQNRGENQ